MRISEIPPENRTVLNESLPLLLEEIEASIKEAEHLSPANFSPEKLSGKLRKSLCRLKSVIPLPESGKLHIWKLSYRLWNSCVDLTNAVETLTRNEETAKNRLQIYEEQAKLRQISADLIFLAGNAAGIPSPTLKSASFFYKTGLIWHDLNKFDLAANCFERATDLTSSIPIEEISDDEERKLLLDLNIARSRTAWEVSDRNLAIALLNRSRKLLFGIPERYKTLAEQFLQLGKLVLSKDQRSTITEASKLLNEALDLCEKGSTAAAIRPDETLILENLKAKTLRFLAAAHLQGDEFENVLKCVRVLRECSGTCGDHPSVPFVAMKAWLGLGRHVEAEKELRGMLVNKEVPEGVCVSAVEAYFHGAGVAGVEAAKGVFWGLLGRCHVSAGAAVRVVQRVGTGGDGEGSKVRAKVVAELVAEETVVALFDGSVKERGAMHATLWNMGAEHFRLKDYETSVELFEKSMLYVPCDAENKLLRAKCFRVLCLCHLGLSQLDQAEEYINEAEKLEPNIASAFLKFKIYLQKKKETDAINQMRTMINCIDFNPEFLILSAHEAMSSRDLPVAVASLSNLLNLCCNSQSKPMPMSEVAVVRNTIALLYRIPDSESEILKLLKRARMRISEIGVKGFFGKDTVGDREVVWFAGNSWNMGMRMGKEKKYETCAEFFELASDFYGAIDGEIEVNRAMVCKSLILSVGAKINGEKQRNVARLLDAEVKKAVEMLDRAGKILTSISTKTTQPPADDQAAIEPSFNFLHTITTYELLGRLDNPQPQQLRLVTNFANSKPSNPQHLLQLGLTALRGSPPNPKTADFALTNCLTALLASTSPDYCSIALVIRNLIGIARLREGDPDDEAYAAYKQAYRIMVGLKEGEYPSEEGKWLATSAWNRSGLLVRLGRVGTAKRWMEMGLELARQVRGMESCRERMEESVAKFEEKVGGVESEGGEEKKQVTASSLV